MSLPCMVFKYACMVSNYNDMHNVLQLLLNPIFPGTHSAAEDRYHQFSPFKLANCTDFNFTQLKMFNLARGISGAVCLIISISILVLLLCVLKAYKSTLQRLIIYHAVLTTLHQLCNVLQLEYQFNYGNHGQSTVCSILGASYMYIDYAGYTSSASIITYLLY